MSKRRDGAESHSSAARQAMGSFCALIFTAMTVLGVDRILTRMTEARAGRPAPALWGMVLSWLVVPAIGALVAGWYAFGDGRRDGRGRG
jgi:hypothetical protein